MKAPYSHAPSLPAMAGLISGIVIYGHGAGCIGLLLCLGTFAALYWFKRHYLSFIALFAAIGIIMSMAHSVPKYPTWAFDGEHTFTAKVKTAQDGDNSIRCIVDINSVEGIKSPALPTLLTVRSVRHTIEPGALIELKGTLTPIDKARSTDIPHETDYSRYLTAEGIAATIAVNGVTTVQEPSAVQSRINDIRNALYNDIVFSPVDGATASFLLATLLGDDTYITDAKYDEYRRIGVAHILALSGMHVGIIVSFVSLLLLPLIGIKRGRLIRSLLSLLIIWGYAVIVGFTPSIVRAAIMVTVFIAARYIGNGYSVFNSLFLSIIIILCICPTWLYSPGFQLSVAAVATILMFGGALPQSLRRHKLLYYALNLIMIPVAAMLGTGIVSAYYFNAFAGMFLFGNIVTGILFPWILTGGVILTLTTACGLDFTLLGSVIDWLYRTMDTAIGEIASYTWAEATGIFISPWVILPYTLMLISAAFAIRRHNCKLWIATAVFCIATIISERLTYEHIPAAEAYVPHYSQATDIIISTGGRVWLYTTNADVSGEVKRCCGRYHGFFQSRGSTDVPITDFDSINCGIVRFIDGLLTVDSIRLLIANSDSIICKSAEHPQYLVLTGKYKGDIAELALKIRPDTIAMGGDMHHAYRKRIIDYCGDSVPYIDLRHRAICIEVFSF